MATKSVATPHGEELFKQAKASTTAATSARVAGTMVLDGKPTSIDLSGSRDGKNQRLTMNVAGEGSETILVVDGKQYLKADRSYWEAQDAGDVADQVGDKYVSSTEPVDGDMSWGAVVDEMFAEGLTKLQALNIKVDNANLDGVPAYRLTDRVAGDGTELWVSADGKANLLKISGKDDDGPVALKFSDWNAVAPITAPAADQVVAL